MSAASFDDVLREGRDSLRACRVATPDLDARVLLCHAAGLTREGLMRAGTSAAPAAVAEAFRTLIVARCGGRPVSRLTGRREFHGLDLAITGATLDPRADTETLVAGVLARVERMRGVRITDLGTGSGAVLVALLAALPRARGTGTDISSRALAVARANARAVGVSARAAFVLSDWAARDLPLADVLVSNPPYIARGEIPGLAREVRAHDPCRALDGGGDGLAAYRAIVAALPRLLRPGGLIALECGSRQAEAVMAILDRAGASARGPGLGMVRDLAGQPRVVIARAEKGLGLRRVSG